MHLLVISALHLLDLTELTARKGTHGFEIPLQALPLWSSFSKGSPSCECDSSWQEGLSQGLPCTGQSLVSIPAAVPAEEQGPGWNYRGWCASVCS